jgi:hypothetical protein
MHGQQFMIKCGKGRSYGDPDQEQTKEKTAGTPSWNAAQGIGSKRNPSAKIQQGCENEYDGNEHWPKRSRCVVMEMWHGTVPLRLAYRFFVAEG